MNRLILLRLSVPPEIISCLFWAFGTMEAETQRKIEEMVVDILKNANIEEATEFSVRVAASERLGIDLSDPQSKQLVRTVVESYLLSIATKDKPPEEPKEVIKPKEEELPQEFIEVVKPISKRKREDSERVICQLSNKRNVVVGDFKETRLVSIREFYRKGGKQLPTTKGISLNVEQWSNLMKGVTAIEEAITKMEGRIGSELNGKKNRDVSSSSAADVPLELVSSSSVAEVSLELVPIEVIRFDGKNYQFWVQQMELLLKQFKIEYVLTEPCPNTTLGEDASAEQIAETKAAEKRWVNDDLICRRNILSHLSDNLFSKYVTRKISAKELWEELKLVYLYEEYGTKRSQVKKYIEFQMDDEKGVVEQIQEFNNIADSINAAGMYIEENFHVSVIISKLPQSWKDFSIKVMREEHLPFRVLMEHVRFEEESRNGINRVGESPSNDVRFHPANQGGARGVSNKPPGRYRNKLESNGKSIYCYVCGQKGHISKNCWR